MDPWDVVERESRSRVTQHHGPTRTITDFGLLVSLFVTTYGPTAFDGGNVSWHWFQFLLDNMPKVELYRHVQTAQGTAFGVGLAFKGAELLPEMNKTLDILYE